MKIGPLKASILCWDTYIKKGFTHTIFLTHVSRPHTFVQNRKLTLYDAFKIFYKQTYSETFTAFQHKFVSKLSRTQMYKRQGKAIGVLYLLQNQKFKILKLLVLHVILTFFVKSSITVRQLIKISHFYSQKNVD